MDTSSIEYPIVVRYTPPPASSDVGQGQFLLEVPTEPPSLGPTVEVDPKTGDITIGSTKGITAKEVAFRFTLAPENTQCGFVGIKIATDPEVFAGTSYCKTTAEGQLEGTPFKVSTTTENGSGPERITSILLHNDCAREGTYYYCFAVYKDLTKGENPTNHDPFDPRITNTGDTGG